MSIMRSTLRTDSNKENGKPEYGFAKFTDTMCNTRFVHLASKYC